MRYCSWANHQMTQDFNSQTRCLGLIFALSKLPWSENTQAKWDLRRMLAHHGKGVPFNLFTISDMHYRQNGSLQMNYKGLLATNPDQTIAYAKPAYSLHSVCSLFSTTP